ncbi:Uma2 family endonuclease [Kamptonema animale CS-326]|jgi:Uma2 family endonuclease|uniref:Uma2 family endonuclease n=1 Tax=Kamptonema animale TaxID=92934 RepID=UPI00232E2EFF|nr:Uma2 family endonuclease [Kamptonema animale]MDB9511301.1 Uma2 family endonuclease [Kamptonema animale CS-326]
MLVQTQQQTYTPEEYRQLEETAEFRSEYHEGEILPMSGGTINHNRITRNLIGVFGNLFQGKPYEVFMNDLRLWIPRHQRGVYPDVMVIEGQPLFTEGRQDEVLNPLLIVEVLSKSTKGFDREDKFRFYRSIPQFCEYVLIDQYEFLVEQFLKTESGQWLFQDYEGDAATVSFTSVGIEMSMSDIYERVIFESKEKS